jgi:hypothetical protein
MINARFNNIWSSKSILLLLSACLILSCSDTLEPGGNGPANNAVYDTFIIDVESIRVPATVEYGEMIPVECFGTIGYDNSYSFCKFESNKEQYLVRITAYGRHNTTCMTCYDKTVPLREVCCIEPNSNWLYGYIYIEVVQSDGSTLVDSVHVGECCEPGRTYAVPVGEEIEISHETLYPCEFTTDFDSQKLRFIDMRCEYLAPGKVGGKWRCYWKYRALRPGRTCATLECPYSEQVHFSVIVTPVP